MQALIKRIEKVLEGVTYRLSIFQEEQPESPRDWGNNTGKMVCWHKRYSLGDEQPKSEPFEYLIMMAGFDGEDYTDELAFQRKVMKEIERRYILLSLYLYDHSGITMSTSPFSCPWDSGKVGFIYISKKDAVKEWGNKKFTKAVYKMAVKCLEAEVKTYDQYLTGDIYGFVIERKEACNKGHEHWEHEDSCWGFFGSDWKDNGMTEHWSKKFQNLFKEEL